jgi:hypothetical protein
LIKAVGLFGAVANKINQRLDGQDERLAMREASEQPLRIGAWGST